MWPSSHQEPFNKKKRPIWPCAYCVGILGNGGKAPVISNSAWGWVNGQYHAVVTVPPRFESDKDWMGK